MRVAILQHDKKEWIGNMAPWFFAKGYPLSTCHIYAGDPLPALEDFDWLIVMGGVMSVYEEDQYPWLIAEKQLIKAAIESDKTVLGICLGGQLIASSLGAHVGPNTHLEIGWHRITKTDAVADWMPESFAPLSWHGDRFDLPAGATACAQSDATPYQAFCIGAKVWALQFHLEATLQSAADFYALADHKLPEGAYVQAPEHILHAGDAATSRQVMHALLDRLNAA